MIVTKEQSVMCRENVYCLEREFSAVKGVYRIQKMACFSHFTTQGSMSW